MRRLIRLAVFASCVAIAVLGLAGSASAQDDDSGYQLGGETGYDDGSGYDSGYEDTAAQGFGFGGTAGNVGLAVGANAGAVAIGVALDRTLGKRTPSA